MIRYTLQVPGSPSEPSMKPLSKSDSMGLRKVVTELTDNRPWVEKMLDPNNGLKTFAGVLTLIYVVIPICAYFLIYPEPAVLKLGLISALAVLAMWLGSIVSLFDHRFKSGAVRLKLNATLFHTVIWMLFMAFVVVTFATAPSIPILSALQGADANAISQERGDFLKGRVGVEIALLYISTILVTTVIPYSIVLLYSVKSKFRHMLAFVFFAYCISFMAKSQFLNLILPLLAYFSYARKLNKKSLVIGVWGSIVVLFIGTAIGFDSADGGGAM